MPENRETSSSDFPLGSVQKRVEGPQNVSWVQSRANRNVACASVIPRLAPCSSLCWVSQAERATV
jgi:hypothetical protein